MADKLCAGMNTCGERFKAVRNGELFWDFSLRGWVLDSAPPREAKDPSHSRYYFDRDTTGEPFIWADCPWCGKELPTIYAASACDDDGN